jgi:hypothetical protein
MKKLLLSFLLLTGSISYTYSQSSDFEGIITYKSDYSANQDSLKVGQLTYFFGDSLRVYFKGSAYKQHYINSRWIQEVTYLPSPNKYYMVFQKFDTLYTVDCGMADDKYTVTVDTKDRRQILGYDCIKLVMKGEKSTKTYYFAPELSLSKSNFTRHKMGGFDVYMQNAKAVYLYMKIENQTGIQELKAVKVEKTKLPEKVFELLPIPIKDKK